jgi:molybdate-binding protein/transcriptional regulator with XRE-family HTH domain
MAERSTFDNDVRAFRTGLGWSQDDLARRSGLSRAGISAIETGRLIPSTAAALALAAAMNCTVETLFRLTGQEPRVDATSWAWPVQSTSCRYWRAEVAGRRRLYPVEVSPLGLLPHDGMFREGTFRDHSSIDPTRTLVLACCDPAVGLLSAELASAAGIRLLVLPRSSRTALELMAQGLVHAAGVHLARSDESEGNTAALGRILNSHPGQHYRVLRLAEWDEGIALAPGLKVRTIRAAVGANIRWVGREPGSGARQCLDELLDQSKPSDVRPPLHYAHDHRGVADAIRAGWADAGICLRLASDEANLSFLSVRQEAYELCFPDVMSPDPRLASLVEAVRSTSYRRRLGELPGYDTTRTGELRRARFGSK